MALTQNAPEPRRRVDVRRLCLQRRRASAVDVAALGVLRAPGQRLAGDAPLPLPPRSSSASSSPSNEEEDFATACVELRDKVVHAISPVRRASQARTSASATSRSRSPTPRTPSGAQLPALPEGVVPRGGEAAPRRSLTTWNMRRTRSSSSPNEAPARHGCASRSTCWRCSNSLEAATGRPRTSSQGLFVNLLIFRNELLAATFDRGAGHRRTTANSIGISARGSRRRDSPPPGEARAPGRDA